MKRRGGGALLTVALDPASIRPLYAQLTDAVRQAIQGGALQPGARLPATRVLAAELGVSRNTVVAMADQLLAEGLLVARVGDGTFVARGPASPPTPTSATSEVETDAEAEGELHDLSVRGTRFASGGVEGAESLAPFVPDLPALDAFPMAEWSRLAGLAWRNVTPAMLARPEAAGWAPLRATIAGQLAAGRGLAVAPDQVMVTSGTSQSLDLVTRLLLDRGETVWLEDPGYIGARSVFTAGGARLVPVPVDAEGLDVEAGLRTDPAPRLIFVSPSRQYPLGVTMSLARRRRLLEIAERTGAWIIEDDYDWEFRYAGQPLPALAALNPARVVHVGTYSKTLLPGLRLGYLVVPAPLAATFASAKGVVDRHPPLIEQMTLHEFMESGRYGAHVRQMRQLYARRQQAAVAALRNALDAREQVAAAETGMHLLIWLRPGLDDRQVAETARRRGVTVRPLSPYYMGARQRQALLAGFAAHPEERFPLAAERLSLALKA